MTTRTRTLIAALALALLSLPALFAQRGTGVGARAEGKAGRHGRMAEYLNLTDQQQASARQLFQDLREQTQPLRQEQKALREQLRTALAAANPDPTAVGRLMIDIHAKREQMKAAREQMNKSFAALLTPEQRQKYDALKDARESFGHRRHGRFGRHGGSGAGDDGGRR